MYAGPFAPVDQGLGEIAPEARIQKELHALAVAIYAAQQARDVERVISLRQQFVVKAREMAALGGGDLTWLDRFILTTGTWIEQSVKALPAAIAALPAGVGVGLIKAALPYALLYFGVRYLMGK